MEKITQCRYDQMVHKCRRMHKVITKLTNLLDKEEVKVILDLKDMEIRELKEEIKYFKSAVKSIRSVE